MHSRFFFSRRTVNNISKLSSRVFSGYASGYKRDAAIITSTLSSSHPLRAYHDTSFLNPKFGKPFVRYIHTSEHVSLENSSSLECGSQNDATMNEFLSRFVWLMRKKLSEAYPDCEKNTINGMLIIIVENVVSEIEKGSLQKISGSSSSTMASQEFSEDLWRTVWEVSNVVLQDMEKEKKKEKMKNFLQSEEVKEMYRFAGQVGIRGDMLRELRFKWAREKMEKDEFYESLERIWKEEAERKSQEESVGGEDSVGDNNNVVEDKKKIVSLPKRHGKIKYKIYGLDLSDSKWAEVANKVHDTGELMCGQEPKAIFGKCKIVTDKILCLNDEEDPAPLLGEWKDLLEPSRIDWIALLNKVREKNSHLYFKAAELVLGEESFQANVRDYSKLVEALAEENHLDHVDRILQKMNENGIQPDLIMSETLVQVYCKWGNLDRAKESFERLTADGYQPDVKACSSMIVAYVNAGNPSAGESLLRLMNARRIKPPKEIFMALLQSFSKAGNAVAADGIFSTMQMFGNFSPDPESLTLMVEAYERAGNPDRARTYFNQMMKLGHKPDDKCTASMIAAYEKRNLLDEALGLLSELEKNGFEPGVATYTVLVDWLSKLELFDEAGQILDKIAKLREAPPFKLHISLCDMYIKSGDEKKALQALGVLESKIDRLEPDDFERVIGALAGGGFLQDAQRMQGFMEARGFVLSDRMKMSLLASQAVGKSIKSKKSSLVRDNRSNTSSTIQ